MALNSSHLSCHAPPVAYSMTGIEYLQYSRGTKMNAETSLTSPLVERDTNDVSKTDICIWVTPDHCWLLPRKSDSLFTRNRVCSSE